jgi:membrane-bound lytic murein transglycosylase D
LKVPSGTAERVNAQLADAAATDLASLNWHSVKRGETLTTIAKKLRVSRNDLAAANYLRTTARVSVGQKLMVPREATAMMAARPERTAPVVAANRTVPETGGLAEGAEPDRVKVIYAVKRGDTLFSIARLFKTTVAAIRTWNPRIPGDRIAAGQRLTLYRIAG